MITHQASKPDQSKCCPRWRELSFGGRGGTGWLSGPGLWQLLVLFRRWQLATTLKGFAPHPHSPLKEKSHFLFQERSRCCKMVQAGLSGPQDDNINLQTCDIPLIWGWGSLERVWTVSILLLPLLLLQKAKSYWASCWRSLRSHQSLKSCHAWGHLVEKFSLPPTAGEVQRWSSFTGPQWRQLALLLPRSAGLLNKAFTPCQRLCLRPWLLRALGPRAIFFILLFPADWFKDRCYHHLWDPVIESGDREAQRQLILKYFCELREFIVNTDGGNLTKKTSLLISLSSKLSINF